MPSLGGKVSGLYEEYPRHLVTLSEPFFIQTTEVTKGQWLEVMGENFDYDMSQRDHPMVVNSVKEVRAFLEKLNQRENGKIHYQLPSEAQWEYAARAGTTSPFFTGENVGPNQANFNGEWPYNNVINGVFRKVYTKVKNFPPNPWGLFDTIGNAYEICADGYDYFFYPRSPIVDPLRGEMEHKMLVGRGGCYHRGLELCTAASRIMIETVGLSANSQRVGLRLVAVNIFSER